MILEEDGEGMKGGDVMMKVWRLFKRKENIKDWKI